MGKLSTALITALLSTVCMASAIASEEPSSSNIPSSDHVWRAADFQAADAALTQMRPLPRSAQSADMFERLTDPASLTYCTDRAVALASRVTECLALMNAGNDIFRQYVVTQQSDISYSDDVLRLMGFTLRSSASLASLLSELLPLLDSSDPSYGTRMQGFERSKRGLLEVLHGTVVTLTTDRHAYSDAVTAQFAATLAETYSSLIQFAPPETKAEFDRQFADIAARDPSAAVRAAMTPFSSHGN